MPATQQQRAPARPSRTRRILRALVGEFGFHEVVIVAGLGFLWRGLSLLGPAWGWIAVGAVLLYLGTWHGYLQTRVPRVPREPQQRDKRGP